MDLAARQPARYTPPASPSRARKSSQVAVVAVARKLACLAWELLTKGEDYALAQPARVRAKLRRVELDARAPPLATRHGGQGTPQARPSEAPSASSWDKPRRPTGG
jgi:hypothetical protein